MVARGWRRSPRAFKAREALAPLPLYEGEPMGSASYFIAPDDLWNSIGTSQAPQISMRAAATFTTSSLGLLRPQRGVTLPRPSDGSARSTATRPVDVRLQVRPSR